MHASQMNTNMRGTAGSSGPAASGLSFVLLLNLAEAMSLKKIVVDLLKQDCFWSYSAGHVLQQSVTRPGAGHTLVSVR